jgi:hypothetical protein
MADKTTIGNQKAAKLTPEPTLAVAAALGTPLELETPEEREESLIERENALAAREARLAAMEERVMARLERLEKIQAGEKVEADEDGPKQGPIEWDEDGRPLPWLDMTRSYGVVIGDDPAGFAQDGHRFSKDRKYLCDEPKGTGKPFNIRMLGLVKAIARAA